MGGTNRVRAGTQPRQQSAVLSGRSCTPNVIFLFYIKLKINPVRDIDDTIIGVQRKDLL